MRECFDRAAACRAAERGCALTRIRVDCCEQFEYRFGDEGVCAAHVRKCGVAFGGWDV
jgi:hypothetical protein